MERYEWLAAVIAAHPNHKLKGRTRLQKTVKLLQRLGAPLDYGFMIYFYGPYSEGIQFEIHLLERFGFIKETLNSAPDGAAYYTLEARPQAFDLCQMDEFKPYQKTITLLSKTDPGISRYL